MRFFSDISNFFPLNDRTKERPEGSHFISFYQRFSGGRHTFSFLFPQLDSII